MNLSFFTKIFDRSVQLSSSFGKTFFYVRDACKYKDKVYQADIHRKNNTYISCVFNGFKYSLLLMSCRLEAHFVGSVLDDKLCWTNFGGLTLWGRLWVAYFVGFLCGTDYIRLTS